MAEPDENLAIARDALSLVSLHELTDATVPEMVARLHLAEQVKDRIKDVRDALELGLINRMEADDVKVPGVGWAERRSKKPSTAGSDWEGARRAARNMIAQRVSLDKATGENRRDWEYVAREAIDLYQQVVTITTPKAGFQSLLGLDPDEYIKQSPGGHTVRVVPESERAE